MAALSCAAAVVAFVATACLPMTDLDGLSGSGSDASGDRTAPIDAGIGEDSSDATPSLADGCAPGFARCGLTMACTDVSSDTKNCGACDRVCSDRCVDGLCHVCKSVSEGFTLKIVCSAGLVIRQIFFAAYGQPAGACGSFAKGVCDAQGAMDIVTARCVGVPTCEIDASNGAFGEDPCPTLVKELAVEAVCAP